MRTPNNQQSPSGSKYYGTGNEISYIENIGTFGKVFITTKQMLKNYINAAYLRDRWGAVDKDTVIGVAHKRLRYLEREVT